MHKLSVQEIAEIIVGYVSNNPNAADSVEGIAYWWIPAAPTHVEISSVERALTLLTAAGVLTKTHREGSPVIYSKNKDSVN